MALLATAPRAIVTQLAGVEQRTAEVIASIPRLQDRELLDVRAQARAMGQCAWQIECAVDAEVLNRFSARAGRQPDTEGRGVTAAVERHAQRLGIHPERVFENARIYRTFFATATGRSSELDKTFYLVALRSADPPATLERIIQAKRLNPGFTKRDAERLVRPPQQPGEATPVPPPSEIPAIQDAWADYRKALDELRRATSGAGISLQRTLDAQSDELWHEINQPPDEGRAIQARTLTEALERLATHYPFYRIQLDNAKAAVAIKAARTLEADECEIFEMLEGGIETTEKLLECSPSGIKYGQLYKILQALLKMDFVRCRTNTVDDKRGSGGKTQYDVWTVK